jgi:hypothetical protein
MRRLFFTFLLLLPLAGLAQNDIEMPKVTLEMETSTNADFIENDFNEMTFKMNRVRLGFNGNLGDNLSYHFRTTFHKSYDKYSVDNISKAVELAKVMYAPNEKWDFAAGKMFVVHGGYENYVNVLLVREFSDFNSNIEVYQTGVQGTYHVSDDHHLTFQVVNNRSESHHELFAYLLPDGIQAAKIPYLATLNWDGFFMDKTVRLLYSTSVSQVAQDKKMYYFTCGNIYEKGPVLAYFDVMYTRAQLDKSQRLTSLFGGPVVQNVQYLTLIADFEYQFTPKWNAYVKGAYETSSVYKDNGMYKKGHYQTTWNAQACVEWLPFTEEKGLKFYLHYVYKGNQLHGIASALDAFIPDTQRISLGLTYSIPVL